VERDGGCAHCHAPPSWTEAHHIRWWERDAGPTDLNNGVLLCTACHHRIHRDGWDILVRDGEVWFVPPVTVDRERMPVRGGRARFHGHVDADAESLALAA
jgi:predicted restriction endonuclease